MRYLLILISLVLFENVSSQTKTIFIVKNKYDSKINDLIRRSDIDFRNINMLMILGDPIDPNGDGVIDYKKIDKYLNKALPDKEAKGIICIDLENHYYVDLKGNNLTRYKRVSDDKYKKAVAIYISLIKYIKHKRPNAKVGVYGMPFKAYYSWQYRSGAEQNLDPILEVCDVLFPSLYAPYLPIGRGIEDNLDFFKLNLGYAFNYAKRLNKPVIPFFWYLTYSQNKETRFELIPKQIMMKYLKYIGNYKSPSGIEVSGIIWWEDSPDFYKKQLMKSDLVNHLLKQALSSSDKILSYYFN